MHTYKLLQIQNRQWQCPRLSQTSFLQKEAVAAKKADQKEREGPAKSVEAKAKAAAEKATKKAAAAGVSKKEAETLAKAAAEKVKKKGDDGVLKAEDLAKHLVKEVSEGLGTPAI